MHSLHSIHKLKLSELLMEWKCREVKILEIDTSADACACILQGARSVGGRHVGVFWTLTGLLSFVWCAAAPLADVLCKITLMCKVS
jgi:hypothetical protein